MLTVPSDRTKQRKIGASGIGNPCPFCLAMSLLGNKQGHSKYWMGARIGTAIHQALEEEGLKHVGQSDPHFEALEGAAIEQTLYIGTIPGYGDIWSTPDLYLSKENHLIDYKTSKRTKTSVYEITGEVPRVYIYQVQLYARALEDAGQKVDKISFVFVNRDGVSDRDVLVISMDYDRTLADEAWDRVVSAWQWLEAGNNPDTLPSDPDCFVCKVLTKRI